MSVAESFLRGGEPCMAGEAIGKHVTTRYDCWCWVRAFPRQWHYDARMNAVAAPCFHLLFGYGSDEGKEKPTPVADWHLLYVAAQHEGGREADTQLAVRTVFEQVPPPLHPSEFSFVECVRGRTHERLGLCSAERVAWLSERLAGGLLDPARAVTPASGHVLYTGGTVKAFAAAYVRVDESGGQHCLWHKTFHRVGDGEEGRLTSFLSVGEATFASLVEEVTEWVARRSGLEDAVDASLPPQGDNSCVLRALAAANPLLYHTRYVEEATAAKAAMPAEHGEVRADPSELSGVAKLKAERDAARATWRATIGACTTFSLPSPGVDSGCGSGSGSGDDEALDFRHVFLLQRPHRGKVEVDMDHRDPGPCAPQPIGAEIHLLPDPGDALHVAHQLSSEGGVVEFTYEDFLQSEGEVLLQLGPVEGVAFADLDRFLAFTDEVERAAEEGDDDEGGGGRILPTPCEGSCSSLVFPRVVFRKPTGASAKRNPIARSHAEVTLGSPTPRMLARAAEALSLMSAHVCDGPAFAERMRREGSAGVSAGSLSAVLSREVGRPGYTLVGLPSIDSSVLGPASRRCGWCMRRRERLSRCSGCKAVYYCSRAHQATDWKEGTHKTDCGLLRRGKELEEKTLAPLVEAMSEDERKRRTPGWACAATLVDFLQRHGLFTCSAPEDGFDVHAIGVEGAWLVDLAAALARLLPPPHPSDSPSKQLRLTVFLERPTGGGETKQWRAAAQGDGTFAENAVLAVQPASTPAFTEVPPTGVIGDVWHLKGEGKVFQTAREAPALIRVSHCSYFRFVEGDGDAPAAGGRLDGVRAVMYVGPDSGKGLGFLYGSLDTVARLVIGRLPVRFVDSSYVGSHRSAGALVARLEPRTDALGVSVRESLTRKWNAMASEKASKTAPHEGDRAERGQHSLATLNASGFAVGGGRASEGNVDAEAAYVHCFFFDVPPAATLA